MYLEDAFDNPSAHLMETVENLSQAPGVVVLDTWTLNGNRAGNATNIIAYPTVDGGTNYRFAIIDQGHCFTGPRWTIQSLEQTVNSMTLQGNNPILAPGITRRDCFEKSLLQLDSLQQSDMRSIVDRIPDEWAISPRERIALLEFLDVRRTKVREIIDEHFH